MVSYPSLSAKKPAQQAFVILTPNFTPSLGSEIGCFAWGVRRACGTAVDDVAEVVEDVDTARQYAIADGCTSIAGYATDERKQKHQGEQADCMGAAY